MLHAELLDYSVPSCWMTKELEMIWRQALVAGTETEDEKRQDISCPDRDLNPATTEYEQERLPPGPSVSTMDSSSCDFFPFWSFQHRLASVLLLTKSHCPLRIHKY